MADDEVAVNNTTADVLNKTLVLAENDVTISAEWTFDRGSDPPFDVGSGAGKVVNLDADKLDGFEASAFPRLATNNTFTGINSAATQPNGSYYNSAVQSVADDTATALTFDTEDNDVSSMHSTSSNQSKVNAVNAGTYLLIGTMTFATDATAEFCKGYFRKNGTTKIGGGFKGNLNATLDQTIQVVATVVLAANDYIELIAHHKAGNALNVGHASLRDQQNSIQVVKLW